MSRRPMILLAALVGLVALGSWLLVGRGPRLDSEPLGNVPADVTAVAWLRVPDVLRSALWKRLVRRSGADRGVRRVERLCGFDPLARLSTLALFASGDSPRRLDHVGVVARGGLDRSELARCVRRVVTEDGGSIRATQIEGVPAVAGRGESRAAFVGPDGFVAGDEATVTRVLRTSGGDAPSAKQDATLVRLFDLVGSDAQVVVVAHVPAGWRGAIRRWVGESLDRELAPLSALRAVGLGARLSRGLKLDLALELDGEADAEALRAALRTRIDEALERPVVTLSAAGPALRRVELSTRGRVARLALKLSDSQLEDLIDLGETLFGAGRGDARGRPREGRSGRSGATPSFPGAPSPGAPDEIIRPHRR